MSTQTIRFRPDSKRERTHRFYEQLARMGFSFAEAEILRRAQMTLHRWDEQECGDGNDHCSWAIERDETTGKPFRCVYPHSGPSQRYPVADREKGTLKRVARLMAAHPEFVAYHQDDCRGCALYLVRKSDVPALDRAVWLALNPFDKSEEAFTRANARQIDSYYSRGFAVCI